MATIVLVHGGTSGGWAWKPIASKLRREGHEVYTPTLTGLGERVHLLTREIGLDTQITDIVNVLAFEDLHDVILVGHSLSGAVITGVADQIPERISKLIYLDAFLPENGECVRDLVEPEWKKMTEHVIQTQGDGWLFPVVAESKHDKADRHRPHPAKVSTDKLNLKKNARGDIPSVYVRFTADKQAGMPFQLTFESSWQRARSLGLDVYEVDTVHSISQDSDAKARILVELVDGL
ncbi:MAG TPA: alpha/beta hydrolase [Anaerolineales bacterium]|nr:alpha/beta hydrolase [Anaerolineales bacterium]